MDQLRALRTFVAIADHGSLTAAAEATGSSLPAVVRTLAALEEHVGTRLFNRTTRRIALTDAGRRYLERSRQVLVLLSEADAELREETADLQGTLRVTAPVMFGQRHVFDALLQFTAQHPRVSVDLQLLDRVVDLVEEGFDLGVRIGPMPDSSLVGLPVGPMRRVLVAAPAYLKARGAPAGPRDLTDHDCLIAQSQAQRPWTFVDERGRPLQVTVHGPVTCNQVAPLVAACVAGRGIGRFNAYQVADELRDGRLQLLLEAFEPPAWTVHLLVPQVRLLPARTRAAMDVLRAHLQHVLSALPQP